MEALVCVNKGFNLIAIFYILWKRALSPRVEEEPKTDWSREGYFFYWSTGLQLG